VSDRRHALATHFTPRRRLRAIYSTSRLRDREDDALATRRFFFFTKTRLTRRARCPFSTHADATTT
jgi:hypothetical protein